MSRPRMGLWFFYTFAFLLCEKVALYCFHLHYLVTFKFARIFIFCEHWYFFYWAKPIKDFVLLGVYLFLMKFLKLFMYGTSCVVPILLFQFVVCLLILYRRFVGVHNADFAVSSRDLRGNDFTAPLLVQIYKGLPHFKTAFVLIYFFFLILFTFQAFRVKF